MEIAEKLNLSTKTISNISQSIKEKLGVTARRTSPSWP
jgi:two-component system invasion response regulator UvrY